MARKRFQRLRPNVAAHTFPQFTYLPPTLQHDILARSGNRQVIALSTATSIRNWTSDQKAALFSSVRGACATSAFIRATAQPGQADVCHALVRRLDVADALCHAAGEGRAAACSFLLNHHQDTATPGVLTRALKSATRADNLPVCSLLLDAATEDARNSLASAALFTAAVDSNVRLCSYFIRRGADAASNNSSALISNSSQVVELLLTHGAQACALNSRALTLAARTGNLGVCEQLLNAPQHPADPQAEDCAALMEAARCGHTPCVRLLLERGAQASAQDSLALVIAIEFGHRGGTELCQLLLQHGADPRAKHSWALVVAAVHSHRGMVQLLLDHGANPRAYCHRALAEVTKEIRQSGSTARLAENHALLLPLCGANFMEDSKAPS